MLFADPPPRAQATRANRAAQRPPDTGLRNEAGCQRQRICRSGNVPGADHYYATEDPPTFDKLAGEFDLILNTVSAKLDIAKYVNLLAVDGTLVLLGAPSEDISVPAWPLLAGRRSIAGSANGGIPIKEMLDFCAEHDLLPETEFITAD